MNLRKNLKLRKVGDRYMLVVVSERDMNTTAVYTFNETAAFVWNAAAVRGLDAAALSALLCEEYDVDYRDALSDVERLLSEWKDTGLISEHA
jgi:hypothetical protein